LFLRRRAGTTVKAFKVDDNRHVTAVLAEVEREPAGGASQSQARFRRDPIEATGSKKRRI